MPCTLLYTVSIIFQINSDLCKGLPCTDDFHNTIILLHLVDRVSICWQSPKVIVVQNLLEAVPLFCISTCHGFVSYAWRKVASPEQQFPDTAVIYVQDAGLYQCIVRAYQVEVKSTLIDVRVECRSSSPEIIGVEANTPPAPYSVHSSHSDLLAPVDSGGSEDDGSAMDQDLPEVRVSSLASGQSSVPATIALSLSKSSQDCIPSDTPHLPPDVKSIASGNEFTKQQLKQATDNFSQSRLIGKGGYGNVYQGYINRSAVAVKVLKEEGAMAMAAPDQLRRELQTLTRCRHHNLVAMMGFCIAPPIIVYELMDCTLYDKLHSENSNPLNWLQRATICKDVARGLAWLHGVSPPIIHGDVKSANVLLDKTLRAKIGDFGFSLQIPTMPQGYTLVTAVMTPKSLGYAAPELDGQHHSPKSDVYSYGMMVLEIFTGLLVYTKTRTDYLLNQHLDDHVKEVSVFSSVADKKAGGELAPYLLNIFFKIVSLTLQKHSRRPSSHEVMDWWNETNF